METENQAAANYVDFQRHFVKLNSILNKSLDGVVMLQEKIPGFFDINGGETANFMLKNDMKVNISGTVKFQINKITTGRVLIYVSDIFRKPNKDNAKAVFDVRFFFDIASV